MQLNKNIKISIKKLLLSLFLLPLFFLTACFDKEEDPAPVSEPIAGNFQLVKRYVKLNNNAGEWVDGTREYFSFQADGNVTYFYKPNSAGGFDEEMRGTYTFDKDKMELTFKWTYGSQETRTWKVKTLTPSDLVLTWSGTDSKGDHYDEEYVLKKQ